MKRYSAGLICLLFAAAASAQQGPPNASELIKSMDKDGDGALTKEEMSGLPFAGDFAKMDTNKDGKVTAQEFEAYMKNNMPAGGPPRG